MNIQSKLPNTANSIFSIMSAMAVENQAINLSQGFPNFPSDPLLIDYVQKAMQDGYNQYAPMAGDHVLREILSQKVNRLYGKKYNPDSEITITAGATQAIFTALAAMINPGDEVIVFTPAYDCYEPAIRLFGGKVVKVQLSAPYYAPPWKEVSDCISEKTRMIIINSPHNPSGMVFSEDDMLQLQTLVEKHNLLVLSDEVYEHMVFDGELHQSAACFGGLAERTFITASFGKTFHNTGWKMGYCLAPEPLMREFQKVHQYNVFCVNHPIQKALAWYMEDPSHYMSLPEFYQQKRDFFLSQLQGSRFKIHPSQGTYFQLLDFSEISSEGDVAFTERLTKQHQVATIPISVFNADRIDFKQIRVCFAKTEETLGAAANILRQL